MAPFWDRLSKFKKQPHLGGKKAAVASASATAPATAPLAAPEHVAKGETGQAYRVLLHPLSTEKAAHLSEHRTYPFAVAMTATKISVSRAIMALYGVRPEKVNMMRVKGKKVRFGRTQGKQKDWKKAVVTLREGDRISVFEGV